MVPRRSIRLTKSFRDDTILPTTWLASNELKVDMLGDVPTHLKAQLDEYAPWAMKT